MSQDPQHTDEFVCDAPNDSNIIESYAADLKYLVVGILFGFALVKGEVINWFRIQEMFRFQDIHMYGIIGVAVVVGVISVQLIKRLNIKTVQGEEVHIEPKVFQKRQIFGGIIFGLGWAITGACPGPLYAQIGAGMGVAAITLVSAIAGTWVFGLVHKKI
jgi:uncharacterized membrane protein YedE/YeeE